MTSPLDIRQTPTAPTAFTGGVPTGVSQYAGQAEQLQNQLAQARMQAENEIAQARQMYDQQLAERQQQMQGQLQEAQQTFERWRASQYDALAAEQQELEQQQMTAAHPNAVQAVGGFGAPAGAQYQTAPQLDGYTPWTRPGNTTWTLQPWQNRPLGPVDNPPAGFVQTMAKGGQIGEGEQHMMRYGQNQGRLPRFAQGGDMGPGGPPASPSRAVPVTQTTLPNGYQITGYSDGTFMLATPTGSIIGGLYPSLDAVMAAVAQHNAGTAPPRYDGPPPSPTYGGAPPAPAPQTGAPPPAPPPAPAPPRPAPAAATPTAPAPTTAASAPVPAVPPVLSQSGSAVSRPAPAQRRPPTPEQMAAYEAALPPFTEEKGSPPAIPAGNQMTRVGAPPPGTTTANGIPWGPQQQAALDAVLAQRAQENAAAEQARQAAYAAERARNEEALAAQTRTGSYLSGDWNNFFAANPGAAAAMRGWGGGSGVPPVPPGLGSTPTQTTTSSSTPPAQAKERPPWEMRYAAGGQTPDMPPAPPAALMDMMGSGAPDSDAGMESAEPNAITGEGAGPGGFNMEVVLTPEGLEAAKSVGGIKIVDKPTASSLTPGSIIIPTKENSNLRDVLSRNIPALDGEPAVKDGGEWTPESMAKGGKVTAKGKGMPPPVPAKLKQKSG